MNVSPCKKCENKGCGSYHDECKPYQEYKAKMDAFNKRKRESLYLDHEMKDMAILKKSKDRRW